MIKLLIQTDILSLEATGKTGRLSRESQRLVNDLHSFLEALLTLGMEKNSDNKIQSFFYHLAQAASLSSLDLDVDISLPSVSAPSLPSLPPSIPSSIPSS